MNEQQYPLVKLVLEQALEPELVRVQAQVAARVRAQVAARVQAPARVQLEPLVQLELLAQERVQLELEQRLQQSCPKPQLHRHRCKVPDRSREPQQELRLTQVHPKALDMTPRVLVLTLEPQVRQEPAQVQGLAA